MLGSTEPDDSHKEVSIAVNKNGETAFMWKWWDSEFSYTFGRNWMKFDIFKAIKGFISNQYGIHGNLITFVQCLHL